VGEKEEKIKKEKEEDIDKFSEWGTETSNYILKKKQEEKGQDEQVIVTLSCTQKWVR